MSATPMSTPRKDSASIREALASIRTTLESAGRATPTAAARLRARPLFTFGNGTALPSAHADPTGQGPFLGRSQSVLSSSGAGPGTPRSQSPAASILQQCQRELERTQRDKHALELRLVGLEGELEEAHAQLANAAESLAATAAVDYGNGTAPSASLYAGRDAPTAGAAASYGSAVTVDDETALAAAKAVAAIQSVYGGRQGSAAVPGEDSGVAALLTFFVERVGDLDAARKREEALQVQIKRSRDDEAGRAQRLTELLGQYERTSAEKDVEVARLQGALAEANTALMELKHKPPPPPQEVNISLEESGRTAAMAAQEVMAALTRHLNCAAAPPPAVASQSPAEALLLSLEDELTDGSGRKDDARLAAAAASLRRANSSNATDNEARTQRAVAENASLKTLLTSARTEITVAEGRARTAEGAVADLQSQLEDEIAAKDEIEQRLLAMQEALEELEGQRDDNATAAAQATDLQERLEAAEASVAAIASERAQLHAELEKAEQKLAQWDADHEEELSAMRDTISAHEKRIEALQQAQQDANTTQQQAAFEESSAAMEHTHAALSALSDDFSALLASYHDAVGLLAGIGIDYSPYREGPNERDSPSRSRGSRDAALTPRLYDGCPLTVPKWSLLEVATDGPQGSQGGLMTVLVELRRFVKGSRWVTTSPVIGATCDAINDVCSPTNGAALAVPPRVQDFDRGAALDALEFDAFKQEDATHSGGNLLVDVGMALATANGLDTFIDMPTFHRYLAAVQAGYQDGVPYHCRTHAADVTQLFFYMLGQAGILPRLAPIDRLACLMAALVHDVGHPGRNNVFLTKLRDPVAVRYSNAGVLERYHAAFAFELLSDPALDFTAGLSEADVSRLHTLVTDMVVNTDMAQHHRHLEAFGRKAAHTPIAEAAEVPSDLLQMLLHAADIGNVVRPVPIATAWGMALREEMFQQGDEERRRGLPISFNADRSAPGCFEASQIGFMDLFVLPQLRVLVYALPGLAPILDQLLANRSTFYAALPAAIAEKFTATVAARFEPPKEAEPEKTKSGATTTPAPSNGVAPPPPPPAAVAALEALVLASQQQTAAALAEKEALLGDLERAVAALEASKSTATAASANSSRSPSPVPGAGASASAPDPQARVKQLKEMLMDSNQKRNTFEADAKALRQLLLAKGIEAPPPPTTSTTAAR